MLLAGEQGSRLAALTQTLANPAVSFGGKYRIIDFALSNCVHSGIDTVGVLTQYQPLLLNRYIGNGQPWDLDRITGGVYILPPYIRSSGAAWYSGTANAIYQNMEFIESYEPKYLLVLSGDHVYKMDYSAMLKFHQAMEADCTVGVVEVPMSEACQYGIMNTDSEGKIVEFEEKPKEPKSNLASMGVYIFTWEILKKYLTEDDNDPASENDFGKNIIPNMLAGGQNMLAYTFEGYWRDVGTLDSFHQANMDMLEDISFGRDDWSIYSRTVATPPQVIGKTGKVSNCIVTSGCEIYGTVENSVLSYNVVVEKGAVVRDSVVMANTVIKRGAVVNYAILDEMSVVEENDKIGGDKESGSPITVVERDLMGSISYSFAD